MLLKGLLIGATVDFGLLGLIKSLKGRRIAARLEREQAALGADEIVVTLHPLSSAAGLSRNAQASKMQKYVALTAATTGATGQSLLSTQRKLELLREPMTPAFGGLDAYKT